VSKGFFRAHVDRASLGNQDGPITFVAATEGRKADGIDLRVAGASLERYRANPVVLYGHRHSTREDLPIGRAVRAVVEDGRILVDVEFDQGDPFAVDVERKIRAGYLNACSIGFAVTEWDGDRRSGVAAAWELHELSIVPVPMDDQAVAVAGRELTPDDLVELIRSALARVAPPPVPPEPEPPAPAGLDQSAARALLAAFTPEEGNNV
jgi:HK97 family phage prohead protease